MREPGLNETTKFTDRKRRPRWRTLILVGLLHLAALFGLARALAPEFTASVVEEATSLVSVTVYTPPLPESEPSPDNAPDEGAAAEEGKRATPREVTAPPVPRPRNTPAPRASSTGRDNTSGARDEGGGTGAGGEGEGTGAGRGGSGQGGMAPTGPSVRSGRIDSARDFPIPEGGRSVRDGSSVTVVFTVGTDGRAYDCSVARAGPDPATNALVCPLVIERIRFNPARDSSGNPVPARYAWRQDFFRR